MTSKEFIITQIDKLVKRLPYLQVRYELDEFSKSHFVEILPIESYKNDKTYISVEEKITNIFIQNYPFETVAFISKDSLFEIESPIYLKKGWMYDLKSLNFHPNAIDDLVKSINKKILVDVEYFPQNIDIKDYKSQSFDKRFTNSTLSIGDLDFSESTKISIEAGNYQYAMAA
jgi:hypothetical protein